MASHKHEWETLHEVYPPAPPQAVTVKDPETGEERSIPFDASHFEGTVGYEMEEPYRVQYCGCGEKKVSALKKNEAEELAIRTGRVVVDVLDVVQRSESSGS